MKKIGLVGYFGWGNFGDELFVQCHHQHLDGLVELKVVHDLLQEPYFTRDLSEVVKDYDGFLIGGGDLLNPVRMSTLYWRKEYLCKPVFITGLGVPNLKWNRLDILNAYRDFFQHENIKMVIARDPESTNWINANIKPRVPAQFFPDPVCSMRRPEATQNKEKLLGVVIRSHRSLTGDLSHLRRLIDKAVAMGYKVRHIVLGTESIGQADNEITKSFALAGEEIVYTESLADQCVAIAQCHALASIKFHGLIVATMYGIPTIALSTTPKNRNFLRMIDRMDLFGGYNQPDLDTRIFHYPARIHQQVRAHLFKQSTAGYNALKQALRETLAI